MLRKGKGQDNYSYLWRFCLYSLSFRNRGKFEAGVSTEINYTKLLPQARELQLGTMCSSFGDHPAAGLWPGTKVGTDRCSDNDG